MEKKDEKDEREPLTETQAECYNALVFWIKEHGYPPTVRELADILDKTAAAVLRNFETLDEKGWIERTKGINRGTVPKGFRLGLKGVKAAVVEQATKKEEPKRTYTSQHYK